MLACNGRQCWWVGAKYLQQFNIPDMQQGFLQTYNGIVKRSLTWATWEWPIRRATLLNSIIQNAERKELEIKICFRTFKANTLRIIFQGTDLCMPRNFRFIPSLIGPAPCSIPTKLNRISVFAVNMADFLWISSRKDIVFCHQSLAFNLS